MNSANAETDYLSGLAAQASPFVGKRALICEDEGVTSLQLKKILTQAGARVVGLANTGKAGVEVALRERPDLVLMDIRMPEMDGLEATRRILDEFPTCIVMITAFSDLPTVDRAIALGASGYIVKPADATHVTASVGSALLIHANRGSRQAA